MREGRDAMRSESKASEHFILFPPDHNTVVLPQGDVGGFKLGATQQWQWLSHSLCQSDH